jgi:hypothetical protein
MKKFLMVAGLVGVAALPAMADAPDASTIVATASTAFEAVGALVVSAAGFFIIVKIVNWIRK